MIVCLAVMTGCKSDKVSAVTDTKDALRKDELSMEEKSELVRGIASDASISNEARREQLKSIAWQASAGYRVRNQAIDALAADAAAADVADTRNMLVLLLGVEPDRGVIEHVCELAAARGWTEFAPPIVRAWSRKMVIVKDEERVERGALQKLFPGRSVEATVYEVFTAPEMGGNSPAAERVEKARVAAWDVLTRIDRDGSKRRQLLTTSSSAGGPAMADLQTAARDLGIVPMTAMELSWLRQLRRPEHAAWWSDVSSVVAKLGPAEREGLSLRHLEALRWASVNEPLWIGLDRAALASKIAELLKGRETFIRTEEGGDAGRGSERFRDNVKQMCWADMVTVLVVDRAIAGGIGDELWNQAKQDQGDTTTEYGGILQQQNGRYSAVLYTPRASQRLSDTRFVASDDMLTAGATALVQYHFHAQKNQNAEYAGPSAGDVEYARDSGRLCVVFTPIRAGVFNAYLYFGDAVRTDLGVVSATTK